MIGATQTYLRRCILVCLSALSFTCGARVLPVFTAVVPAPTENAARVVVLRSSPNQIFEGPATSFANAMAGQTEVYDLVLPQDNKRRDFKQALEQLKPQLLFTLGTPASVFSQDNFPDTPSVFAMVVNYQRIPKLVSPKVAGVSLEIPALTEFTQFKMVLPQMKKVTTFYVPGNSQALIDDAKSILSNLAIELRAVPIGVDGSIEEKFGDAVKDADALWLLNDPGIMNPKTFRWLQQATLKNGIPFVSSLSEQFAREGALMSVSIDFGSLGFQAASMAQQILVGTELEQIGVQAPIGGRLVLNLDTAQLINLEVPKEILPFVSEIVQTKK